jgi:hypothetical protein
MTHFDVIVAIFWFLRSTIVSGDAKNEPVAKVPILLDNVDPDEMMVGYSPGLTRNR